MPCALLPGYEIGTFFIAMVGEFFLGRCLLRGEYFQVLALVAQVDPSKDLQVRTAQLGMREGFVVAPKWKAKGEGEGART